MSSYVRLAIILLATVAAQAEELLVNPGFTDGLTGWTMPDKGKTFRTELIEGPTPGSKALRCTIAVDPSTVNPWTLHVRQHITKPVTKGTPLTLRFKMRGEKLPDILSVLEENAKPFARSVTGTSKVTDAWTEYTYNGVAKADYPAGGWKLAFNLALGTGVVDLADLSVQTGAAP